MTDQVSPRALDPEGVEDGDYVLTVSGGHVTGLATMTGGGSGVVETIVAGTGITVDDTDPANPVVSATGAGGGGGPTVTTGTDTSVSSASTNLGVLKETVLVSTTTITPTVGELVTVAATATASGPGGAQGAYINPGFRFTGTDANQEPPGSVTNNQTVRNPLSATPIAGEGMFWLKPGFTYTLYYRLKTGSGGAVPTTTFTNVQASFRRAQSV